MRVLRCSELNFGVVGVLHRIKGILYKNTAASQSAEFTCSRCATAYYGNTLQKHHSIRSAEFTNLHRI